MPTYGFNFVTLHIPLLENFYELLSCMVMVITSDNNIEFITSLLKINEFYQELYDRLKKKLRNIHFRAVLSSISDPIGEKLHLWVQKL